MSETSKSQAAHERRSKTPLVRHSSTAAVAGALAVASGILFDAAIAISFGADAVTDAFWVAARIPMGIQAVLTVAATQALVPLVTAWLESDGEREVNRRITRIVVVLGAGGLALAGLGALLAEPLTRVTAPGLAPGELQMATSVARLMFLVVPLEAVGDVFEAFLNARYSFVIPSGAKLVRNMSAVVVIVAFAGSGTDPFVIAIGYLTGMILLVSIELVAALTRGLRPMGPLDLRDPTITATLRHCTRPVVGASVNPVVRLIEQVFISFLPAGAITISQLAYRLVSAVGGTVFFRSVMVTMVPRLTEAISRGNRRRAQSLTRNGVRIMIVLGVLLTVATVVLGRPVVFAVFQRGRFTSADASLLGWVLLAYAFSFVGSGVQRAMLAPFFARLDTRVPLRNTMYGNLFNLALLPLLLFPLRERGAIAVVAVGIAYSAAQYVHVGHAWYKLKTKMGMHLHRIVRFAIAITVAGLALGGIMLAAAIFLDIYETSLAPWQILLRATFVAAAGAAPALLVWAAIRRLDGTDRRLPPVSGSNRPSV